MSRHHCTCQGGQTQLNPWKPGRFSGIYLDGLHTEVIEICLQLVTKPFAEMSFWWWLITVAMEPGKALRILGKKPCSSESCCSSTTIHSRWLGREKEVSDLPKRSGYHSGSQRTPVSVQRQYKELNNFFFHLKENFFSGYKSCEAYIKYPVICFIFHFLLSMPSDLFRRTLGLCRLV